MRRYEAVLFDWMLTLAHYPTDAEFCRTALQELGRPTDAASVAVAVGAIEIARADPSLQEKFLTEDISIAHHRAVNMELFERAGFDQELSECLYARLGHSDMHPLYPDVVGVLEEIRGAGTKVAVISDIHVDLRDHAHRFGIAELVDCWILSYELGVQKPDPLMFTSALDALGVAPDSALMVGDRVSRDGAAAQLGIDTLILPARWTYGIRGLERVARLVC